MTNKLGSSNPNKIKTRDDIQRFKQHKEYILWLNKKTDYNVPRYPLKKLSKSAINWLTKNKIAQKYINAKAIEYYHNGQVKQVVIFVGGYDDIDMMELDWIDYDEQGNMMVFKTKKARFSWTLGKDMEYRMQMNDDEIHECRGVIFPEKKPSTKTGTTKVTDQDEKIIEKLVPLFAGDLKDLNIKKMDYYKEIGDDYGLTADGIRKVAQRCKSHIDRKVKRLQDNDDAFYSDYLLFYVKNATNKGIYKGINEIRWMQEIGDLSHLLGLKHKF